MSKRMYEKGTGLRSTEEDAAAYEIATEERAVQLGIVFDRPYVVTNVEGAATDGQTVWLFVPVRTSKRSIANFADSMEGVPRFLVRVRCLTKYIYSDKFDVAFNLTDGGAYYLLPINTFGPNIELRIDRNPAILEFVRAQHIQSMDPSN